MLDGYRYAYRPGEDTILCLAPEQGPEISACGHRVDYFPVAISDDPEPAKVCRACVRKLAGITPEAARPVACPACGQGVRVDDGRLAPHPDRSGSPCVAVNLQVRR